MEFQIAEQVSNRAGVGPFDISEVPGTAGYIDFGAILLPASEHFDIRLDLEAGTDRIIAISIEHSGSVLQLQAFAAPKTEGVWSQVREQLRLAALEQGGRVVEQLGSFGTELLTSLPIVDLKGKSTGFRKAKFIGIDGPRWFLRGVIEGSAIEDRSIGVLIDAIFRKVVVNRGETPIPPRDLLPFTVPSDVVLPPRQAR